MIIGHHHNVAPDLELIKFSRHVRLKKTSSEWRGVHNGGQGCAGKVIYLLENILSMMLEVIVSVGKSIEG